LQHLDQPVLANLAASRRVPPKGGNVREAEFQFAEVPTRYRLLNSWDATHWIDGGDPQSSPSIHLDRITLPTLAAEKSETGAQRKSRSPMPAMRWFSCMILGAGHPPLVRASYRDTAKLRWHDFSGEAQSFGMA